MNRVNQNDSGSRLNDEDFTVLLEKVSKSPSRVWISMAVLLGSFASSFILGLSGLARPDPMTGTEFQEYKKEINVKLSAMESKLLSLEFRGDQLIKITGVLTESVSELADKVEALHDRISFLEWESGKSLRDEKGK